MKGKGVCKLVYLILLILTITKDFLALEIGNVDVTLGLP